MGLVLGLVLRYWCDGACTAYRCELRIGIRVSTCPCISWIRANQFLCVYDACVDILCSKLVFVSTLTNFTFCVKRCN